MNTDHALYKLLVYLQTYLFNASEKLNIWIKSFKSNYSGVISDGHKH